MLAVYVILYLILTVLVGAWAGRMVRQSSDFVNAGRRLPVSINAFAFFALWFGSETLFGATSEFVQHGFPGIIEDPFGGALCLLLFGLFFVRPLYRLNLLTLGDLFRLRMGHRVELVASIFILITFLGYIAAQLVALGILLQVVMGLSLAQGVWLSAIIVCSYTLIGGMWAVSITDFVQSILIIGGLLWLSIVMWGKIESLPALISNVPERFYSLAPEQFKLSDILTWLAAWMALGLGSIPSQDIFQRMNAAKSESVAVKSTFLGAGLYLVMAMLPLFIVLAAKQLYPELLQGDLQQILPQVVIQHGGLPLQVIFFGALISAIFSTCSGAILAPASILSENIIKPLWKTSLSDKQFLLILRLSVVVMTAASLTLALGKSNVYELVGESSVLGLVSLLVPMMAAIWDKKASAFGAILSMCCGMGAYLVFEYLWYIEGIPSSILGLFISALAYMLVRGRQGNLPATTASATSATSGGTTTTTA
ncbi:sodium:solute symporter family protein [Cytophagales bacterium LB-30]|uniref:Sodium:solute symporter family protein n=1 Tax=Shiella aurantiaca TaxID=3058365 RepID=A0ABT8F0Q8_9BACT|nr:sodium:solute symporter family protein [Shiella aurantiaca]MDN4163889.1 sodium:solute symporter family protein [Shiella aurantiaca]